MKKIVTGSILALSFSLAANAQDATENTAQEMVKEPLPIDEATSTLPVEEFAPTLTPTAVTTLEDAKAFAEIEFLRADLDANGQVSIDEFAGYLSTVNAVAVPAIDPTQASTGSSELAEQGGIEPVVQSPEEAFATISENDEIITKDEMIASREKSFEKADQDGDALLNDEEKETFAALILARDVS